MLLSYLDPGSGSALVGTVIAIAGAALFSLKSVFYRIFGGGRRERTDVGLDRGIALFSEGRNYWETFREIVDELIRRRVHFAYYTMDLHDPALLIDSEFMHARLFDVKKVASFQKLAKIKARTLLTTTPNIGTPGYPLARPAGVERLVHMFHAFADISAYHVGSLDCCDTVLSVGLHQEKPIREVERARGLKPKVILPMGLPYFDAMYHGSNLQTRRHAGRQTVLVASSWGAKGLLKEYGTGVIRDLAKAGYEVIVRPHPHSRIVEADFIERCKAETADLPNVVWDFDIVGAESMRRADLLVSDTSSIRFDFAFLYERPVITLDIPRERQLEYEGQFMSEIWADTAAHRISRVLDHASVAEIAKEARTLLPASDGSGGLSASADGSAGSMIRQFRDETIVNLGTSAKAIVDFLQKEVA